MGKKEIGFVNLFESGLGERFLIVEGNFEYEGLGLEGLWCGGEERRNFWAWEGGKRYNVSGELFLGE